MNIKIIKKLIFLYSLIFPLLTFSANDTSIRAIANLAGCKAVICNRLKCASVDAHSTKKLNQSFDIPFISIKQNLKEFVKDIPFVPASALKITTKAGVFRIWKNQSGVVSAPDPSNAEAIAAWKLKILLDEKNNKNVNLTNLALEVDKDGNLDIKQQRD